MKRFRHIPGAGRHRWWQRKSLHEAMYSIPPVGLALIGALRISVGQEYYLKEWMFAMAAWLTVTAAFRIFSAHTEDKNNEPNVVHEGLYAAASAFHAMLSHYCKLAADDRTIRVTFHRVIPPVNRPQFFEQIIPYVGWNTSGTGRKFSINTGITGHALRNRTAVTLSSPATNEESHRKELVNAWGYTDSQARQLSPGRYSAMAVPVLDRTGQQAIGVVYLDSSNKDIFLSTEVQEIIVAGSSAISKFISERYQL